MKKYKSRLLKNHDILLKIKTVLNTFKTIWNKKTFKKKLRKKNMRYNNSGL